MFQLELLENDPNTPAFYSILITVLFAFFLSSVISITYELTTKSIYRNAHFLQSMALISIVAAMVIQAIGDSVARGLGMLGALAIIRFRTVLNDPRNMAFMFASLAAGISCGVWKFSMAITGTIVFCLGAVILRLSPWSNANELVGNLKIQVPKGDTQQAEIEKKLKKHCQNFELNQLRYLRPVSKEFIDEDGTRGIKEISRENLQEFYYLIRLKNKSTVTALTIDLNELESIENINLNFKKQPTSL